MIALTTTAEGATVVTTIFTYESSGTGRIGSTLFSDAPFVIEATADTQQRIDHGSGAYSIIHDASSISVEGVGTFDFTVPTRTFVNNDVVGFSWITGGFPSAFDLLNSDPTPAFASWDLTTSLGPVQTTGRILQWGFFPSIAAVPTSGGESFVSTANNVPYVFTATVIPEAASSVLLCAVAMLGLARRARGS